jgi:hypothetical protein
MAVEFSSVFVRSIKAAVVKLDLWEKMEPRLSEDTRSRLNNPTQAKWHPMPPVDETVDLVSQVGGGAEGVTRLYFEVMECSMTVILRPLTKLLLTLHGNSPRVLFENFNRFIASAVRPSHADWQPLSLNSGEISITYGTDATKILHPLYEAAWMGVIDHTFFIAGRKGTRMALPRPAPNTVRLHVKWE